MAASCSASWTAHPSNSVSRIPKEGLPSLRTSFKVCFQDSNVMKNKTRLSSSSFTVKAAKLPAGVVMPKVEPKLQPPFAGFTRTAEIWNSRACMIGLIGTFIVELIINKGILQVIGVEVGKGLDIPL